MDNFTDPGGFGASILLASPVSVSPLSHHQYCCLHGGQTGMTVLHVIKPPFSGWLDTETISTYYIKVMVVALS